MTAEAQIIPVVKEFERVQKDANRREAPHTFGSVYVFSFFVSSSILSNCLPCSSPSHFWENLSKNYPLSKVKNWLNFRNGTLTWLGAQPLLCRQLRFVYYLAASEHTLILKYWRWSEPWHLIFLLTIRASKQQIRKRIFRSQWVLFLLSLPESLARQNN